jgi:catechol 2,3-dioxygenase-like lactoylglutathione lyase family enzyme
MAPNSCDDSITFCNTVKLEETHHFYHEMLELPLALDAGRCRIYRIREGAFIGFCTSHKKKPEGIVLTMITDKVDEWFEKLKKKGVIFEKEPGLYPEFKIYNCFFRDPNGYLLEIQRFEEPFDM